MERRWGNDNGGGNGWKSAAFKDLDGSLGGGPNSYIVNDIGILSAIDACESKPTWNAVGVQGRSRAHECWWWRRRIRWRPASWRCRRSCWSWRGCWSWWARRGRQSCRSRWTWSRCRSWWTRPRCRSRRTSRPGSSSCWRLWWAGWRLWWTRRRCSSRSAAVVLSRNGKEFTVTGETPVVAGTEIKVATERPNLPISVSQLDSGSWVIFELPGFTTAASGTEQNSLDALRKASATSYYKGKDELWVKVVSTGPPAGGRAVGFGGAGGGRQHPGQPVS